MIYKYNIEFYDEMSCAKETDSGFVVADNLRDACSRVAVYYGEDNTNSLTLQCVCGSDDDGHIYSEKDMIDCLGIKQDPLKQNMPINGIDPNFYLLPNITCTSISNDKNMKVSYKDGRNH